MPTKQPIKKPRRPGRPVSQDQGQADPREQLLDIALRLFSEQGIAATPMSAIARQAGISAAMMHYYFNNRDQLLDVLVEERILPIMQSILAADLLTLDTPQAFLPAMAARIIEHMSNAPWLPALWVKEILSEGGLLRSRFIAHFSGPIHTQVLALLRRWQAEGKLPVDLNPGLLLTSVIGLTIFPLAAADIWRQMSGMDTVTNQTLQQHAAALLLHGITHPAPNEADL